VKCLIGVLLFLTPHISFAQIHYRLSADFSIKESDGSIENLSVGKVYYNLSKDILVYSMHFPEKLDWVISDTSFFIFRDEKIENRYTIPKINTENILHLSLTSHLNDFGLSNTNLYKLLKTTYESGLIISIYEPKTSKLKKTLGKVIISLKNGNFNGIVFFNSEEKIVKKLIVQDSQIINGIFIPNKILEIIYSNNIETYKVTSFSDFRLNEKENEKYYNYNLLNFNK
jgi:hypothetical protein|tara:strand:+ start:23 stop:706 length:684 start_codon:yes stop_codon:yes gene_type:complete